MGGSLQTMAKCTESCWGYCRGLWVVAGMGCPGPQSCVRPSPSRKLFQEGVSS